MYINNRHFQLDLFSSNHSDIHIGSDEGILCKGLYLYDPIGCIYKDSGYNVYRFDGGLYNMVIYTLSIVIII